MNLIAPISNSSNSSDLSSLLSKLVHRLTKKQQIKSTTSLSCLYYVIFGATFRAVWIVMVFSLLCFSSAQESSTQESATQEITTQPLQVTKQINICEKAETAGFLHYGKYLLSPKDFQNLTLQPIVQPYLSRLNQMLESKDIKLISLVLPPRAILFPEFSPQNQQTYYQLISDLQTTGIQNISISNVVNTYGADFFFESDHHWTPFAAREVAKEIAKTISIDPDNQQDFRSSQIRYSWSPYNSRLKTLSRLCGEDYGPDSTNETDEEGFLTSWTTTMAATEGLFDTRTAEYTQPSVLVGTSNSESSTLNFAGFLSEQTGLSISNYAFSSSGALGSMMRYFLSLEYQQSKPKFIFWEFLANPHTTDFNLNAIKYYRQIIPSISGSCETESLASTTFNLEDNSPRQYLSLFLEEPIVQDINSSSYYLAFDITGDFLDRLIVDIEYNSNTIDQNSLHLLAPIAGKQQAYLEFLDIPNTNIRSINLSFPSTSTGSSTTVIVDLCLTPQ